MSVFDQYEADAPIRKPVAAQPPAPEATLGEAWRAGWGSANTGADWGANQGQYEFDLQWEMIRALKAKGHDVSHWSFDLARQEQRYRSYDPNVPQINLKAEERFYKALAAERKRDPNFGKDWADVHDPQSLVAVARAKRQADDARNNEVYGRTRGIGNLAYFGGSVIGRWWDPLNYVGLPGAGAFAGGARTVAGQVLRTGAVAAAENAAVTLAMEPLVREDAATNLGQTRSASDTVTDMAMSAVFGGVLGAAGQGLASGIDWHAKRGGLGSVDRRMARALASASPDDARMMGMALASDGRALTGDHTLVQVARTVLDGKMTPDQAAALTVLEHDLHIAANSPYKDTPAGDAIHRTRLASHIDALLSESESAPTPSVLPDLAPDGVTTGAAAKPVRSAPATPNYAPRDQVKARIRHVESSGDDNAPNQTGSRAFGRYQFIPSTWLAYYKRRYGSQGLSDGQILQKRSDGSIQDILMDDLMADNGRMLARAGQAQTAGNLYLAHFAGPRAIKVLQADPATPLANIFTPEAMAKNPHMQGKTAGWLVNWAHHKMGDPATVRGHDVPTLARENFGGDEEWYRAQAEETWLAMERMRADTESAAQAARDQQGLFNDETPLIDDEDYDLSAEWTPVDMEADGRWMSERVERIDLPRLPDDIAITVSGQEFPVRYAVVDAATLQLSHDDVGRANSDYPAELQPRDRSRGVSQAQIADIAARLDPRLLGRSPKAGDGAPIISEGGLATSGNGRLLSIRRAYAADGERAAAYRAYVTAQAPEAAGMSEPALVRILPGEMSRADLIEFAQAANARDTAGFSATEQAMTDATHIDQTMLELFTPGGLDRADNRDFVRAFLRRAVSQTDYNGMVTADGMPSTTGYRRIEAAMLAKAYGQASLVAELAEASDTNVKGIGQALSDVSGRWAQMVAAAEDGAIDPAMDITTHVNEAVALVQKARAENKKLADIMAQRDVFTGEAVSPFTEAVLRLFFDNDAMTKPVSRKRLAAQLDWYAREAMKAQPGTGLFGEDFKTSPDMILGDARGRRFDDAEANTIFDAGEDAPPAGQDGGDAGGQGVPGEAGDQAGSAGGFLDVEALRQWDDPKGPAAESQTQSLEHDMRMVAEGAPEPDQIDAFGGVTPADTRAMLERKGEGRKKGGATQKPPGSDGGLFDAGGVDMAFDIDGETKSAREIFDEIDRAEREADAVAKCAMPKKGNNA